MPRKQSKSAKKAKKAVPASREEKEETIVTKGKMTPRRSPRGSSSSVTYVDKTSEPPSPKSNRLTRSSRSSGRGSAPKEKMAKLEEPEKEKGAEAGSSEEEEEEEDEAASEEGSEYEVEDDDEEDYKPVTRKMGRARGKRAAKTKGPKSPPPKRSARAGRKRKASDDDDDDDEENDKSYKGKLRIELKAEMLPKIAPGRLRRTAKKASTQQKADTSDDDKNDGEEEGEEEEVEEKEEEEEEEEKVEKVSSRGRPQRGKAAAAAVVKALPVKSTRASRDKPDNAAPTKRPPRLASVTTTGERPTGIARRARRGVTLEAKLDVLRRLDEGETLGQVSKTLGLPTSTVATIRTNRHAIRASCEASTPLTALVLRYNRNDAMVKMEQMLNAWIVEQAKGNVPLVVSAIQEKAKSLYKDLAYEEGDGKPFHASRGWFERFKKRCNLHDLKLTSETASNAEMVATRKYAGKLKKVIDDGGYTAEQVFSVDETRLVWKKLPLKTGGNYAQEEHKLQEHITVLLGGNAGGDFKLRPLVVNPAEDPAGLTGYDKLPVILRWNRKAEISAALFQEWFVSFFVAAVKRYCAKRNVSNKALLVVDSAPCHPGNLNDLSDNVRVEYIPRNTAGLLQPMRQGVMDNFRALYLKEMFRKVQRTNTRKDGVGRSEEEFSVMDAVDSIAKAWDEVKPSTLNSAWQNVWPRCTYSADGVATEDAVRSARRDVVDLARSLGYEDMEERDVEELLRCRRHELVDEEGAVTPEGEDVVDGGTVSEDAGVQLRLTAEKMSKAFSLIDESLEIFSTNDPNRERSLKVARAVNEELRCYRQLYRDMCCRRDGLMEKEEEPGMDDDDRRQAAASAAAASSNASATSTRGRASAQRKRALEEEEAESQGSDTGSEDLGGESRTVDSEQQRASSGTATSSRGIRSRKQDREEQMDADKKKSPMKEKSEKDGGADGGGEEAIGDDADRRVKADDVERNNEPENALAKAAAAAEEKSETQAAKDDGDAGKEKQNVKEPAIDDKKQETKESTEKPAEGDAVDAAKKDGEAEVTTADAEDKEKRRAENSTGEEPSAKKAKKDADAAAAEDKEEKMEVDEEPEVAEKEKSVTAEPKVADEPAAKEESSATPDKAAKSSATPEVEESAVNGKSVDVVENDGGKEKHINTNGESCDAELRMNSASLGAAVTRKTLASESAEGVGLADQFSVVSYNVSGVSSGKHQSLVDELSQLQAAVVCLQEVETEYFESTLNSSLKGQGYASLFKAGKAMDKGLATCYRSAAFEAVSQHECEVGDLLQKEVENTDLNTEVKSVVATYLQHPSPVLFVKLKHSASGKVVSVANFQLQSQEESVQVLQVAAVIQKLVSVSDGASNSHILCGTFNVDKDSSTIEMIKTGRLNNERMEALKQDAIIPIPDQDKVSVASVMEKSFNHPSSLKSSYGTILGHELDVQSKVTGLVKSSIWFSSSSICATSVLNVDVDGVAADTPMPKDSHVALKVDFGFVQ